MVLYDLARGTSRSNKIIKSMRPNGQDPDARTVAHAPMHPHQHHLLLSHSASLNFFILM